MFEIWITGMGAVSALGSGIESHVCAAREARSGLALAEFFEGKEPDPVMCGRVPLSVLPVSINDSSADRANRLLKMAMEQALAQSGLGAGDVESDVAIGTTLGNINAGTGYYKALRQGREPDVSLVRHFLPCAPMLSVCSELGIRGRRWSICSACTSGVAALGKGLRLVRDGLSKRVLVGGVDALSPYVVAGFNSLRLVSSLECRPFDKNRQGLNPGEGSAVLVLEDKNAAKERGAGPIAAVTGFGEALEGYHHTRADPSGKGVADAVTRALGSASLSSEDVDHIHLHGTGTLANDVAEYMACRSIFGDRLKDIPVCSTKSMTGHTFGAAGALASCFAAMSTREGLVPPTLFHEELDMEFADLCVSPKPIAGTSVKHALVTTLGFGGESAAAIISRVEDCDA